MDIRSTTIRVDDIEGEIKCVEIYDKGMIDFCDLVDRWPRYDETELAYLTLNFLDMYIVDRKFKDHLGVYYSAYKLNRFKDQSLAFDFPIGLHFVKIEFDKKDLKSFFSDLYSVKNCDFPPDFYVSDFEEEDISSWYCVKLDLSAVVQLEEKFPELFEPAMESEVYENTDEDELERLTKINIDLRTRIAKLEANGKKGIRKATVNDFTERMPEIVNGVFLLNDKWNSLEEDDPRFKYGFTEEQVKAITGIRNKYVIRSFKIAINKTERIKVKKERGVSKST